MALASLEVLAFLPLGDLVFKELEVLGNIA